MARFTDPRQRVLYTQFRAAPPTTRHTGLGQAYYFGFEHPFADYRAAGPRVGALNSLAYAAFRAGQDNARSK